MVTVHSSDRNVTTRKLRNATSDGTTIHRPRIAGAGELVRSRGHMPPVPELRPRRGGRRRECEGEGCKMKGVECDFLMKKNLVHG